MYHIYSCIRGQFLAQFRCSSCGGRLIRKSCHTARVSMMLIGQWRSLCVCRTWRGPLVGHYRAMWMCGGEHIILNDHTQTCAAAA